MSAIQKFTYLVIGGGSGGIASARRAAATGVRTALIERSSVPTTASVPGSLRGSAAEAGPSEVRLGGTCVNVGCVPKKIMYNAASLGAELGIAADYGFSVPVGDPASHGPPVPFSLKVLKQKRDAYISRLNGIYKKNCESTGVSVFHGTAKFIDAHTVAVGETVLTADHIVIATGGRPFSAPSIIGLEHTISSDGVWDLEDVPKELAVLGGGYIAVELAGVFAGLGSRVTLFVRGDKDRGILRRFDDMVRGAVREGLEAQGVRIVNDTIIQEIQKGADGRLHLVACNTAAPGGSGCEGLVFDTVLAATGRTPNTEALDLTAAGVAVDKLGHITVDAFQNTNVPGIYAIGDVTGRWELTPVAIAAGRLLADRLFAGRTNAKLDYSNIPTIVFSHPPVGTVGISEEEAKVLFGEESVKTFTSTFTSMFYSMSERKVKTRMKMVTRRMKPEEMRTPPQHENDTLKVVGVHIVGDDADEMLQGYGIALKMGACKSDFDSVVALHPTSAEEIVTMPTWFPRLST